MAGHASSHRGRRLLAHLATERGATALALACVTSDKPLLVQNKCRSALLGPLVFRLAWAKPLAACSFMIRGQMVNSMTNDANGNAPQAGQRPGLCWHRCECEATPQLSTARDSAT
jgi:hypothetical protein